MNPIRKAIYEALTGSQAVTDLLATSTSVFHYRAPQGAPRPYIVIHKVPSPRVLTFAGPSISEDVWVVKAVDGPSEDEAPAADVVEEIDAAIDAALDRTKLTIPGHHHLALRREADVEFQQDDGRDRLFYAGGQYRVVTQPQ